MILNKNPFRRRYRIVCDCYSGYEAQVWNWYFPIWLQLWDKGHMCNTHSDIEGAEKLIEKHKKSFVVKVIS